MPEKIELIKEGEGYGLYINGLSCGWGALEDELDVLVDKQDNLPRYAEEAQDFY